MINRVVVIEPIGIGGICHYTYNLCEALAASGVGIWLITARNYELAARPRRFQLYPILSEWFRPELPVDPQRSSHPSGIIQVVQRRLKSAYVMARIVAIALKTRASVVHLHWPVGPHDWIYLTVLRGLGRRIVYTAHDILPHESTSGDVPRLSRLLKQADRVILHSEENERVFRRVFSSSKLSSSVVPHGHYRFFTEEGDQTSAQARADLGIPLDARVALFFGTIRPYKGLADLIKAFSLARTRVRSAHLIIAGRPFEDFARYERAIMAAGINDCTVARLGYHAMSDVAKFFRATDLVVLPYRSASQSGVVQLAFAFAKAVIATRVGGLPEVIDDGRTGLLVEAGDDVAMADAMVRLFTDAQLRHSMGVRASEVAASRYSWDRIAQMTLDVYDLATERVGAAVSHA